MDALTKPAQGRKSAATKSRRLKIKDLVAEWFWPSGNAIFMKFRGPKALSDIYEGGGGAPAGWSQTSVRRHGKRREVCGTPYGGRLQATAVVTCYCTTICGR